MQERERLQMMLADFESDKLRQMARNPGGDRGYAGIIEKFVKQRPRFSSLIQSEDYLDRLRQAVRELDYDRIR